MQRRTSTPQKTCPKIAAKTKLSGISGNIFKKLGAQAIGVSRGGRTTKIHLVAASDRQAVIFSLSPGNSHDAPEGRKLIESIKTAGPCHLLMDQVYEDDVTRELATGQGFTPVVLSKATG